MQSKWRSVATSILLVIVAASSGLALARADPLPQFRLVLESSPANSLVRGPEFIVKVTNEVAPGDFVEARNIRIGITPKESQVCTLNPGHCPLAKELQSGTTFDTMQGVWTIPSLPPGKSAQAKFRPNRVDLGDLSVCGSNEDLEWMEYRPVCIRAMVLEASSDIAANQSTSQPVEEWYFVKVNGGLNPKAAYGDARVEVSVEPDGSGQPAFKVTISTERHITPGEIGLNDSDVTTTAYDVQVKISLNGLQLVGESSAPDGTVFETSDLSWQVGTLNASQPKMLSLPARHSSLEGVSIEERCLTATITSMVPSFRLDTFRKANDVATACLDAVLPVLPHQISYEELTDSEFFLWWIHDCLVITTYPCDAEPNIKVLSRRGFEYLDLESAFIHIPNPGSLQLMFKERMEDFAEKSLRGRPMVRGL